MDAGLLFQEPQPLEEVLDAGPRGLEPPLQLDVLGLQVRHALAVPGADPSQLKQPAESAREIVEIILERAGRREALSW